MMVEFLQQNGVGILFVVAMVAMHFGGRRHGGHGGMPGCSGHSGHSGHSGKSGGRSASPKEHADHRVREAAYGPPTGVPDPTRDAYSPDDVEPGVDKSPPLNGARGAPLQRKHGC